MYINFSTIFLFLYIPAKYVRLYINNIENKGVWVDPQTIRGKLPFILIMMINPSVCIKVFSMPGLVSTQNKQERLST